MSKTSAWWVGLLAVLAGCNQLFGIGDPSEVRIDGGSAGLPDAMPCTTPAVECQDDQLLTCLGHSFEAMPCPLGCLSNEAFPIPHCGQIAPSNFVGRSFASENPLLVAAGENVVLDSDSGVIYRCNQDPLDDHAYYFTETVGVWLFSSLTVENSGSLRVVGTRAAAFSVFGTAQIDGTIDVSAGEPACSVIVACNGYGGGRECAGPGGGMGGIGADGEGASGGERGRAGTSDIRESGGGGGGFGSHGGRGGFGDEAADGGDTHGEATCSPLVGGSGGGAGGAEVGGNTSPGTGVGGGGGGALQISASERIVIGPTGVIRAGGAGGANGLGGLNGEGGGGGGAGGSVLLEAPAVDVSGTIAANGGGGGGGGGGPGAGNDGAASAAPATGGVGTFTGGVGGARSSVAGGDGHPINRSQGADASSGGGGGAGRIYIRVHNGQLEARRATISPVAGEGPLRIE